MSERPAQRLHHVGIGILRHAGERMMPAPEDGHDGDGFGLALSVGEGILAARIDGEPRKG